MLIILSPAKRLDFSPPPVETPATQAALMDDAAVLMERARTLTAADIRRLCGVSAALADLNHARFQRIGKEGQGAKQAALTFAGDVYAALGTATLTVGDWQWAQDRLRILSGLYGVLRPLDLIQPYRLEMKTKLDTARGPDLYAFWKGRLSASLNKAAAGRPAIINLASQEYFKAVADGGLTLPVITPKFMEDRGGKSRVVGMRAKRARGAMARRIIVDRLEEPEQLKAITENGYRYRPNRSTADVWVFSRP